MKKRDRPILIILIMVFVGLAVFEPSYGWRVRQWLATGALTSAGNKAAAYTNGTPGVNDAVALAAQNEALKAQLASLQSVAAQLPHGAASDPPNTILAMVYSRYPFNFKNELLVNAGAANGAAVGQAVIFDGVFIGTVTKTFNDTALIKTVFDDNFKMAVRVGSAGYDALFEGGSAPLAASIVKSAAVMPGDIVYAADPGVPYGLPVAVVAATGTSPDGLFESASLGFAYDINTIQSVLIER